MNGKLVDTNVIIRVLKGVSELFYLFDDMEKLFVSSVSVGELMYGAQLSKNKRDNTEGCMAFCKQMNIEVPDEIVGLEYGKIKVLLKKNGTPIPENDIWIAATAKAGNLILVTADSDFKNVDGLLLEMI